MLGIQIWSTNSLFGILGPFFIILATAVLTARANAVKIWRDNYEAAEEKNNRLENELIDAKKERDEQRELKHTLKAELAGERMKTDLTVVMEAQTEVMKEIANFHKDFIARGEVFEDIIDRMNTQRSELIGMITDAQQATTASINNLSNKIENAFKNGRD